MARLNRGGLVPLRVSAYLLLFFVCRDLLGITPAEAKPHEVNFEGVGIPVESKRPLGGGMVAISFAGEEFVTAEAQAGRSVATRFVRRSNVSAPERTLLVLIVAKALERGDSQLLNVAIEAELLRTAAPPDISTEIWKPLLDVPLGRAFLTEALLRHRDTFSPALCRATFVFSERGGAIELSESVATRCLHSEVERVREELSSSKQIETLTNRAREAVRAFGVARAEGLQNARLLAGHLQTVTETLIIEEYVLAREFLSRQVVERARPPEARGVFGSLDDNFLNRLSNAGKNDQAILFLAQVPFESRTQRTHLLVLNVLGALRQNEYGALRERVTIEALSRFANRDSEIATAFGQVMARALSDASASGLFHEVIQAATAFQGAPESVKQSVDPVIASVITTLITRGDRERAEELRRSWARPLPVSLRFRWWMRDSEVLRYIGVFVVVGLFMVVARRIRTKKQRSDEATASVARVWPVGYEDALQQVGLAPGISLAEIKQAYRAAVKREHPDLKLNATPEDQEKFREIVATFERIMELHQRIR